MKNNYFSEIEPLLLEYFEYNQDKLLSWLYCPNYLFGYFSPITLILTGDKQPMIWVEKQLELKNEKKF